MARPKLDVGGFVASLNQQASKLDTNEKPRMQYIDIDLLDANEKNFYSVDDVESLASSIAMSGLDSPLIVRSGENGRYTIVAGHRRRAALRKLVEEDGREDLRQVPCFVREYKSAAMEELQLIMSNSTARVLTSAETMNQAKKVEDLLYRLKGEGVTFPGRMRSIVAEACQVSESKLARLKVIRDKLIGPWMAKFEAGEISEDVAYTIAQLGQDYQISLHTIFSYPSCYGLTKNTVEGYRLRLDEMEAIECICGSACTNRERMIEHTAKQASPYYGTCKTCCASCVTRSTCGHVCPLVEEQVAQEAKARQLELEEERAKREEEAAERANQEKEKRRASRLAYQRLFDEADRVGMSDNDLVRLWFGEPDENALEDMESIVLGSQPTHGLVDWDIESELECGVDVAAIVQAGISLDYVLTGKRAVPELCDQWQQGTPTENGYYFCIKRGSDGAGLYWWNDDHWELAEAILPVQIHVDLWAPVPLIPGWRAWKRKEV